MDTELLDKVMDHIRMNPDQHDQQVWVAPAAASSCGTVACFAGWTLLMSGEYKLGEREQRPALTETFVRADTGQVINSEWVPWCAKDLLGLDEEQANALFYVAEDFDAVEVAVKAIHNEEDAMAAVVKHYEERAHSKQCTE